MAIEYRDDDGNWVKLEAETYGTAIIARNFANKKLVADQPNDKDGLVAEWERKLTCGDRAWAKGYRISL